MGRCATRWACRRVRVAYTAGEAIGPDLFSFYRSIGINLKQLYGSTETAVFVCLQPDNEVQGRHRRACRSRAWRSASTDGGEILVRSPGLLKEYYKNPARDRRGARPRTAGTTPATPASSMPAAT